MSTYNGSLYIVEQINSILAQNDVNVKIIIRDDGSQDDTVSKINELKAMHPNSIFLIEGNNVGYRKSFLNLFKYISEADYYCFSDQDDFWKPNKIINAINILSNAENIGLYASSLTLTDEHLNTLSQKTYNNRTFSLQSFFIRTQLAGCTYVFKPKIANFAKEFCELNYSSEEMPDHDALICIICR
ncbi:glycosyltransferase, partial [Streptococcus uberis]|uniref:glycosyltransferase n=1 Tax=Streptococcus uberis TaxID=1349 RepID=UPI0020BEC859